MVGGAFFLKGFIEQVGVLTKAETVGEGFGNAVSGDFIMLDAVAGSDQDGIANVPGSGFAEVLFGLGDEAFHRFAKDAIAGDAMAVAYFPQAVGLVAGFCEMIVESQAKVIIGGVGNHFRERLDELGLRAEEVGNLVEVELFEGRDHVSLVVVGFARTGGVERVPLDCSNHSTGRISPRSRDCGITATSRNGHFAIPARHVAVPLSENRRQIRDFPEACILQSARKPMKIIQLLGVIAAPLLFSNCRETRQDLSKAEDLTFARETFESLARGDSKAADRIDWAVFTSLGTNVGATYTALPTAVEKQKFAEGFITQFATSFRESGGSVADFTNWRVTLHDSLKTEVAADSPKGVLTVTVSERDNLDRVSALNMAQ